MTCYYPLQGWLDLAGPNPATGKTPLVFFPRDGHPGTAIRVPCGQCIGCRIDRTRSWAIRCVHEASLHNANSFVTLTYGHDLPVTDTDLPTLRKRDITLFFKKLRNHIDKKVRYLICGEYGDKKGRPHYHACIFGYDFPDRQYYKTVSGIAYYTSPLLSVIWPHGFNTVGDVNFTSASYVASYCIKRVTGGAAKDHYQDRVPEFAQMSRRPGLGADWIKKYGKEVYQNDMLRLSTKKYPLRMPKYYDRLYDIDNPAEMEVIRSKRLLNVKHYSAKNLLAAERAKKRARKTLKRSYEDGKTDCFSGV